MSSILANWKTTAVGVIIIVLAALKTFAGINVPGAMDLATALMTGTGLIFAKDSNVTGGTTPQ